MIGRAIVSAILLFAVWLMFGHNPTAAPAHHPVVHTTVPAHHPATKKG